MITFTETGLRGAFVVEPERFDDERGFFARSFSDREFEAHGINPRLIECNISYNRRRHTLRGMHYQAAPHAQAKLVRCTRGAVFDVIIDLRPASPTFRRWLGLELTAENPRQLYVPEGFAHGFQTLKDDTEIFYQMSARYEPSSGRGVRWDDPAFGIEWPEAVERIMAARDREYPDFNG
ncbi:MAG TPA: dTDP-4-dehydrorhamnose 3,5-epimerase [Pyrinomonadaceae bacterium]|nr:dTDP-4-dehydrorhamnose 3,5-epimerase [Pyrinomonadaceae bacterium]